MFSSDRLRKWLKYAEDRTPPEMIPMSGPDAEVKRYVSVRFQFNGEILLFKRIVGDQVYCLGPDENDFMAVERVVGIYDLWGSQPNIREYWGLVTFEFDSWSSFTREQTFRIGRLTHRCRKLWWRIRLSLRSVRKRVSVQRYAVLNTVNRLSTNRHPPTAWDVANSILGRDWADERGAFERLDQVEVMLDALVELNELRKKKSGFVVTGAGVAALSQYEEEERKHRESLWMQRWIALLTVAMFFAALLQAKVIEFPPLLKLEGPWPWQ